MRLISGLNSCLRMIMALLNLDLSFTYLFAQSSYSSDSGAVRVLELILSLAEYVFSSYCFYTMLEKLDYRNAWFAWVPFLNVWAILEAGDRSPWWIVGFFIPFVNIVAAIYLIIAYANIVKKLGKNPWLILLMIIPFVNFAMMYHFAFG
ncbi:MAG: DUF5684 domain-containing protein [Rivularia sp. (in: cyanobacteria)]